MRLEKDSWHPILKDMVGSIGRQVRPMVEEIGRSYNEGWGEGWEWLTRGANFLVTARPGGPWSDGSELSINRRRAWREGWADGILAYLAAHPEHYGNRLYPQQEKQE